MAKKLPLTLLIASTFFIPLTSFSANFYKWTDENGTVHYSQRKPDQTPKALEEIKTHNTRSSTPVPIAGVKEKDSNKVATDTAAETEKPKREKRDPALCQRAKQKLQTLKSRPIVQEKGRVISGTERQNEMDKLNKIIGKHC